MKNKLTFYPKIVFRTPLFSQKYSLTIDEIHYFLKHELVQEAIFIASPDFYKVIHKYLNNEFTEEKELKKVQLSAYKYLIRMMNRPTPFGLFAACSVANWGELSYFNLPTPAHITRKPRLEVTFLATLMEQFTNTPPIQKLLRYQLNTTIYRIQNKITYVRLHDLNQKRTPAIETANVDGYLEVVLKETRNGQKLSSIAQKLQQLDDELSLEEINCYLEELINAQILISEWLPNITGVSFFHKIIKYLNENKGRSFLANTPILRLQKINDLISEIETRDNNIIPLYKQVYEAINQLHPNWAAHRALQLDTFKMDVNEFVLTDKIQRNLLEAIKFLTHFRPALPLNHLAIFKNKFKLRYEKQEVPLLELMDASIGLGYPIHSNKPSNFLLVNLPINLTNRVPQQEKWQPFTKVLHQLLVSAHKKGQYKTDLQAHINFKELDLPTNFPPSKSLVFSIIGKEKEEPLVYLKYLGASSGVNLISRFAHGHPEIAKIVNDIGCLEEAQMGKETVLAEVVHFPEFGAGNLLSRPAFRPYEIPYLCKAGVSENQQIALADLTVSLKNEDWVLHSKKLNKAVIPRLSNSHDFHKNVHPVYRFLGDLQYRSRESSRLFSWGVLQSLFHFFPRIFYKNIILSRACWRLTKSQYPNANKTSITKWQEEWNIPRYIAYGNWDKELVIDLSNPIAVELFLSEIKHRKEIIFYEVIFDAKTCPVQDINNDTYKNEFIATIMNSNQAKNVDNPLDIRQIKNNHKTERSFLPGSNWVYFKIYSSTATANTFLLDYLYPFLQHFYQKKVLSNAFFIRYRDEFDHLRVRVLLNNPAYLASFMQAFQQLIQQTITKKLVWKLQLDTYDRELERYGKATMVLSESIFGIDTMTVLQVLQLVKKTGDTNLYWQFGILAINQYLGLFPIQERKALAMDLINRLGKKTELNQKEIHLTLNKKYRKLRPSFFLLFEQVHPNTAILAPILSERSAQFKPVFTQLKNHFSANFQLMTNNSLKTLISSFIHLTINRLYQDQQPYNEFVLYYLLEKHYTSMIARAKKE